VTFLGLVPPDELVMRTGGPASCRTLDLAGKDPHANGMEISTALKTTSIILHRKLVLDRRTGNGQLPAKSMRKKPELSANRCLAWAARGKGWRQGLDRIIAVG
jgi:hypothetical protein